MIIVVEFLGIICTFVESMSDYSWPSKFSIYRVKSGKEWQLTPVNVPVARPARLIYRPLAGYRGSGWAMGAGSVGIPRLRALNVLGHGGGW